MRDESPNWMERTGVFLVFVFLVTLCGHRIIDVDVWWHLKAGEFIVNTLTIPHLDIFSYTSADHPWIDLHWLYQVILYFLYRWSGSNGLLILKCIVILSTFVMLFRMALQRAGYLVASVLLLLALLAFERYLPRPEIFTELFIAMYLVILFFHKYKGTRLVYLLPVMQVLWVNTEGLFILGLVILAAFLAGELLSWKLPWPAQWKEQTAITGRRWLVLFLVTIGCVLACFANPYGLDGVLFPFILLTRLGRGSEVFSGTIAELLPPPFLNFSTSHVPLLFYNLLIAVSVMSFLLNFRRLSFSRLLIYGCFLFLSFLARRNISLFACVAMPLASLNLGEFCSDVGPQWKSVLGNWGPRIKHLMSAALIVTLLFLIWSVITNRFSIRTWPHAEFGAGFSPYMYPIRAVDFIEEAGISGNVFNNIGIGGYLCWRGYPERKVFIDGRLEVHERAFYTEYIHVMQNPDCWDELAEKYNINYVVLQHSMEDTQGLIGKLYRDEKWRLVYFDDLTVVFLRNVPENKVLLDKFSLHPDDAVSIMNEDAENMASDNVTMFRVLRYERIPFESIHKGTFYAIIGLYHRAIAEYQQALRANINRAQIYYDMSIVYTHQSRWDEAITMAYKAAELRPQAPDVLENVGFVLYKKGRYQEAEQWFLKALAANTTCEKARYDLANLYMAQGLWDSALIEFQRMIHDGVQDARAHCGLAMAYVGKGLYDEALEESLIAVQTNPRYAEGYDALGFVLKQLGRFEESASAYQRAIELNPKNVTARVNLGVSYIQMSRFEEAGRVWVDALALDPTNRGIRMNLERLSSVQKGTAQ